MQFFWELVPGAREGRNNLAIGYAWLATFGLMIGVPHARDPSHLKDLLDTVGSVGQGIAASFAAFLFGSFIADLSGRWLEALGGRLAPTADPQEDLGALYGDRFREDATRLKSERDKVAATIDKLDAEVVLRLSLIAPLVLAGAVGAFESSWQWALAALGGTGAMVLQIRRRLRELRGKLHVMSAIRDSLVAMVGQYPAE